MTQSQSSDTAPLMPKSCRQSRAQASTAVSTTDGAASLWHHAVARWAARSTLVQALVQAHRQPDHATCGGHSWQRLQVFWCRHCHNHVHDKEEQVPPQQPAASQPMQILYRCAPQDKSKRHQLVRTDVKELVCALCDLRQPVSAACADCRTAFGQYTCLQCNFFEDDFSKGAHDAGVHCMGCFHHTHSAQL